MCLERLDQRKPKHKNYALAKFSANWPKFREVPKSRVKALVQDQRSQSKGLEPKSSTFLRLGLRGRFGLTVLRTVLGLAEAGRACRRLVFTLRCAPRTALTLRRRLGLVVAGALLPPVAAAGCVPAPKLLPGPLS